MLPPAEETQQVAAGSLLLYEVSISELPRARDLLACNGRW